MHCIYRFDQVSPFISYIWTKYKTLVAWNCKNFYNIAFMGMLTSQKIACDNLLKIDHDRLFILVTCATKSCFYASYPTKSFILIKSFDHAWHIQPVILLSNVTINSFPIIRKTVSDWIKVAITYSICLQV